MRTSEKFVVTLIVLCVVGMTIAGFPVFAFPADVEQSTVRALRGLSVADQTAIILSSIEQRSDVLSNVDITSQTRMYNTKCTEGHDGTKIDDSGWFDYHMVLLDGSYRLEAKWYLTQEANTPEVVSVSNFREDEGYGMAYGRNRAIDRDFGRIDVNHDPPIEMNRIAYWLHKGSFADVSQFPLEDLISRPEEWLVEYDDERSVVIVSVPYSSPGIGNGNVIGKRAVHLDPAKGMAPLRAELYWQYKDQEWEEKCEMHDLEVVNGVWLPMSVNETVRSFVGEDGVCSHYLTRVESVELGNVDVPDLDVVIPAGARVVDVLKGVSYDQGSSGSERPLSTASIIAGAEQEKLNGDRRGRWLMWLIIANAFVVSAVFVVVRMRS